MAIKTYCSVGGLSKEIKKLYCSVNGKTKELSKLYASVNGVSKLIYQRNKIKIVLSHKDSSSPNWTTAEYSDWNSVRTAISNLKTSYGSTAWDIKIEEGAA